MEGCADKQYVAGDCRAVLVLRVKKYVWRDPFVLTLLDECPIADEWTDTVAFHTFPVHRLIALGTRVHDTATVELKVSSLKQRL